MPKKAIDPRPRLAAERTLLAWVRSALALIAFGFLIERFELLAATDKAPVSRLGLALALSCVGLGAISMFWAAREYRQAVLRSPPAQRQAGFGGIRPLILAFCVALIAIFVGLHLILAQG